MTQEREFVSLGGIQVPSEDALRRTIIPPEEEGPFEQAASRVTLAEGFSDPDLSVKIFQRAMEKREVTIPQLLVLSMAGNLMNQGMTRPDVLGGSTTTGAPAPYGSQEGDWTSHGLQSSGLTETQRMKMWRRSRELGQKDGMLFSLLRRLVIHTCGKGPWLYVKKDPKAGSVQKRREDDLDLRRKKLFADFGGIARLLVWQTYLHGTLPVINFPIEGYVTGSRPQVRPCVPDYISKLHVADGWSLWPVISGCTFDVLRGSEVPRGYVPKKAVTLLRVHQEGNDGIWGLSVPFHIITELMRYMDWLEQRRLKSRVDNMTLIIRYLESSEAMGKREIPNRPMVIDAPMDKEKWEPLNTGGGSSRDATGGDGREFRLRMAAAAGWAEHYLTGDAQYAAQMGKDAFPVALLEYYQETLEIGLIEVASKTLGCGRHELGITWAPVDMRDRSARVTEATALHKDRLISRAQVHRTLNYDHDKNEAELDAELAKELTSGPPGATGGFGGMGMTGLFPAAPAAPVAQPGAAPPAPGIPVGAEVTLPSGLTMPVKTILVPRRLPQNMGGQTVFIQAAIPADTFAGKLKLIGEQSDLGVTTEDIIEVLPEMKSMMGGADYGYAAEGAAIFGGESVNGDIVIVGEATFKRVKSQDSVAVYQKVKERYPEFEHIFTGSDEPELTDTLNEAGFKAEIKHIGEDRTRILISGSGRRVLVYYECVELLSDLFPNAAAKIAGMNVQGRHDHKDAYRYLVVGVLELLGVNEKV